MKAPLLVAAVLLSACKPAPEKELVVFAASSLKDVFGALGGTFKQQHPEAQVSFNFAGTQELRTQLEHGAPADVFASADVRHMADLERAGRVQPSVPFARNELVLVVSPEASRLVKRFEDATSLERIVMGGPDVPIGRYTRELLQRASMSPLGPAFVERFEAHVVSKELSARQVLARVSLGEAQAAFVYRTDARSVADAGVDEVPLPEDLRVVAEYPIALVTKPAHPALAAAWVDLVRSAEGQRQLSSAGFLPVSP
ncbi:MAG: molybdate ABC transporter substrate-binding protein [Archangiaceae bacterium]|nr:molybdate ABC transporter substrate-binding protein [Archangiaceae bacterium]